jgi:hypothetical protein
MNSSARRLNLVIFKIAALFSHLIYIIWYLFWFDLYVSRLETAGERKRDHKDEDGILLLSYIYIYIYKPPCSCEEDYKKSL